MATYSLDYPTLITALVGVHQACYSEHTHLPPKLDLSPNQIERMMLSRLCPDEYKTAPVEDAWISPERARFLRYDDPVEAVKAALEAAWFERRFRGGYPCFNKGRWNWANKPARVAGELNARGYFDFLVYPAHVVLAQREMGTWSLRGNVEEWEKDIK